MRTRGLREPSQLRAARSVTLHYERQLARHGATARGMDWKDEASQRLRFEILCGVCDLEGRSLREVGAGAGHLRGYLGERGIAVMYSGSDASLPMVEAARRLHPGVRFDHRDVLSETAPPTYDVVVGSGLFHVKLDHQEDEWRAFVRASLRRMFGLCRIAIAFNLMSDQVDFRSPELFYASPAEVFDFCRRELSRYVVVRHDYPLHEFSVYVRRDGIAG